MSCMRNTRSGSVFDFTRVGTQECRKGSSQRRGILEKKAPDCNPFWFRTLFFLCCGFSGLGLRVCSSKVGLGTLSASIFFRQT